MSEFIAFFKSYSMDIPSRIATITEEQYNILLPFIEELKFGTATNDAEINNLVWQNLFKLAKEIEWDEIKELPEHIIEIATN